MAKILEQVAENPFWFYECFLMPMPQGRKVQNLRELLEGLREIDESVLFYHLIQSRLALDQPAVEYPNDFAFWAANALQDSKLAEKLSSFDLEEWPLTIQSLGGPYYLLISCIVYIMPVLSVNTHQIIP